MITTPLSTTEEKMVLSVCANVCIDEYIQGNNTLILPAGKGVNVAVSLKNIGVYTECLMLVPKKSSKLFKEHMEKYNIPAHYVLSSGEARRNRKIINSQGLVTEYSGTCDPVSSYSEQEFIKKFAELAPKADYIVISGSLPVGIKKDFYRKLIEIGGSHKCIFDSSRDALKEGIVAAPFMIKPNLFEFNSLSGKQFNNDIQILEECKKYISQGIKYILLSMGSDGAIITDGVKAYKANTFQSKIVNTTGAGDCMLAAAIKVLLEGGDIQSILSHAVSAASLKIGHEYPFITDLQYQDAINEISIRELI